MVISTIILLLDNRFKTTIYLLPILYLVSNCLALILQRQSEDVKHEEWSFKKYRQLVYERSLLEGDYYAFCVLFAPNVAYLLLIYTPIFVVMRWLNLDYRLDMNESLQFEEGIESVFVTVLMAGIFFFILHTRELSRFFQQRNVVKKES